MKNRRGVTLVELMIAVSIVSVLAVFMTAVMKMGYRSSQARENMMSVSHELRRGVSAMTRELAESQAASLTIPADGNWYNGLAFLVPEDLDGDGTVLDAAGDPEWGLQVAYALGGLDGNQVTRTQNGAVRVMANGVTALQFRRQAALPNVVEIFMTVQKGNNLGGLFVQQSNFATRVRLRN